MFLSKIKKLIFFHVPKTAGSSLKNFLVRNCKDGSYYNHLFYDLCLKETKYDIKSLGEKTNTISNPFFSHISQSEFVKLSEGLNLDLDNFTEIVIVRNPYDRLLSYYNFTLYNNYPTIDLLLDDLEKSVDLAHKIYFRSQLDYIKQPVSKNLMIFKYEELEKCEQFLQHYLNTSDELPEMNVTEYSKLTVLSDKTKERCYELFKEEFKLLGYEKI